MLERRVCTVTKDGFHSLFRNVMLDGLKSFLRSDHQVHVNLLSHGFRCTLFTLGSEPFCHHLDVL